MKFFMTRTFDSCFVFILIPVQWANRIVEWKGKPGECNIRTQKMDGLLASYAWQEQKWCDIWEARKFFLTRTFDFCIVFIQLKEYASKSRIEDVSTIVELIVWNISKLWDSISETMSALIWRLKNITWTFFWQLLENIVSLATDKRSFGRDRRGMYVLVLSVACSLPNSKQWKENKMSGGRRRSHVARAGLRYIEPFLEKIEGLLVSSL